MSAAVDLVRLHHITEPIDRASRSSATCVVQASEADGACHREAVASAGPQRGPRRDRRLETEGDQLHRRTTALLFSGSYDAFTVLRWKDIVETLEGALNAFERTADIITSIALKHA